MHEGPFAGEAAVSAAERQAILKTEWCITVTAGSASYASSDYHQCSDRLPGCPRSVNPVARHWSGRVQLKDAKRVFPPSPRPGPHLLPIFQNNFGKCSGGFYGGHWQWPALYPYVATINQQASRQRCAPVKQGSSALAKKSFCWPLIAVKIRTCVQSCLLLVDDQRISLAAARKTTQRNAQRYNQDLRSKY